MIFSVAKREAQQIKIYIGIRNPNRIGLEFLMTKGEGEMKKLITSVIAAAICLLTAQIATFAIGDDTGIVDFNELMQHGYNEEAVTEMKAYLKERTGNAYIGSANTDYTNGTGRIYPYKWDETTESEYAQEFGTSIRFDRGSANGNLFFYNDKINGSSVTEFAIMKTDNSRFVLELRIDKTGGGDSGVNMLEFGAGNEIKTFDGQKIATYETNKWYDVRYIYNCQSAYARIGIKEHGAEEYNYYDGFYLNPAHNYSAGVSRITLTWYNGSNASTAYIDNLRVQRLSDAVVPTLNSYGDDFEGELIYLNTPSDWTKEYRGWNINGTDCTAKNTEVPELSGADGKVLKLDIRASSSKTVQLGRKPFAEAKTPRVFHDIKFKIGGGKNDASNTHDGSYKGLYVYTANSDGSKKGENWLFGLMNDTLQICDYYDGAAHNRNIPIKVHPDKLYDCEFIYDAENRIARVSLTGENGRQVVTDIRNEKVFGTEDGTWANLSYVVLSLRGANCCAYFDDFKWNIHQNGLFEAGESNLLSGLDNSANMDESVVFNFNQTINGSDEGLADAIVTVKEGDEAVAAPTYRFKSFGNAVAVNFKELDPNTCYTVSISGVKNLAGEDIINEPTEKTFTTNQYDVLVTGGKPTVDAEGNASATMSAAYSEGKNVKMISAAYDENGILTEVICENKTIERTPAVFSVSKDLFTKNFSYVCSYIWSDFTTLIPFSEVGTNKN